MKMIFKQNTAYNSFSLNISLLILRLAVGLGIALAHGMNKLPPSSGFISGLEGHGFPFAIFFAWSAGLAEFLGGILLALGLATRLSSLSIMTTMAVAIFIWHAGDPFAKIELASAYLIASFVIFLVGSGSFSLDRLIQKYSR